LTGRADPKKKHTNPADPNQTRGSMFGNERAGGAVYADSGGASRFFYCPKANRKERDLGCEDMQTLSGGEATGRKDGSAGTKNPRAGAGRGGGAKNHHPTVKPIALCEYLAKLIMPPKPDALLVPFAGSGSEMIGSLRAGWPVVVGIERELAYVEIARRRLAAAMKAAA
jgi:site-specific DNA-methyltransferase (adenine-specific)